MTKLEIEKEISKTKQFSAKELYKDNKNGIVIVNYLGNGFSIDIKYQIITTSYHKFDKDGYSYHEVYEEFYAKEIICH